MKNSIIYHVRGIGLSLRHANLIIFFFENYGKNEIPLSYRKIANTMGYSYVSAGEYLKDLEAKGLITAGGTDKKRTYKLNIELLEGLLRG
ncbi:MAG: hypothetical protein BGN96_01650 [Bacteroidales bacterium 45-6]|nr:MAG: hypothetical protein BGN96_01650 [Bacteroidales bacterium 45-6]